MTELERLGAWSMRVRRPEEMEAREGLVLPGGESTTMARLARTFEPLCKRYEPDAEFRSARSAH